MSSHHKWRISSVGCKTQLTTCPTGNLRFAITYTRTSMNILTTVSVQQVLTSSLGPNWQSTFTSFTRVPFAAASIGQVHAAVISASASPTGKEEPVAVKVQFPNVADSIASDLGYVKLILTAGRLLPKGLFLDRTLEV
jgi:predicted unusual protein kinase regulating ubiquinone biosynthesis (AarF/ABC1/UbiB family)